MTVGRRLGNPQCLGDRRKAQRLDAAALDLEHRRIDQRPAQIPMMIGGLTGLPLAWGATAGPIATAGFGILAILWLWTTMVAWRLAVDGRFAEHRRWMIRSIALTAAGIMLRVYLGTMLTLPVEFYEGYRVIAFLCWVPNILLAELYLRRGQRVSAPAAA